MAEGTQLVETVSPQRNDGTGGVVTLKIRVLYPDVLCILPCFKLLNLFNFLLN